MVKLRIGRQFSLADTKRPVFRSSSIHNPFRSALSSKLLSVHHEQNPLKNILFTCSIDDWNRLKPDVRISELI